MDIRRSGSAGDTFVPFTAQDTQFFESYRALADAAPTPSERYVINCAISSARSTLEQLRVTVRHDPSMVGAFNTFAFFDASAS